MWCSRAARRMASASSSDKRERLFDHDVEVMGCGRFDDAAVLSDGGVHEQRLRLLVGEEVVEGCVEEAVVEMELLLVFGAQRGVGVDDAHEFCVVLFRELLKETDDMAVLEADDGDANGGGLSKNLRDRSVRRGRQQRGVQFATSMQACIHATAARNRWRIPLPRRFRRC